MVGAGRADIGDLLLLGDGLLGLLPLARLDHDAARRADAAQRVAHLRAVGRARRFDRERQHERRVVAVRRIGLADKVLVHLRDLFVEHVERLARRVSADQVDHAFEILDPDLLIDLVVARALGADELLEEAALERLLEDDRARRVRVADHEQIGRLVLRERRELGAERRGLLVVLEIGRDLAAELLEFVAERAGKALAVIVVHVGERQHLDAALLEQIARGRLPDERVRRTGAEHEVFVVERRQRRRGRSRRDHDRARGNRRALGGGDRGAAAQLADDADDLIDVYELLGGGGGGLRIALTVRDDHVELAALADAALLVHLLDGEFGAFDDGRNQRRDRAGDAE